MQSQLQFHHQQVAVPNQLKNQQLNGNLTAGNSFNRQPKVNGQLGQTQLEKQLLQPPTYPGAPQYTPYSPSVNGLLPIDENIGTKEQRRERKRKHNVKELFSTKRPRGSEKLSSSKARIDKKSLAGNISEARAVSSVGSAPSSVQSPVNGLMLGVDPMFPANPLKVEGLPSSSGYGVNDKSSLDLPETDVKKRRKRLKKKQDGEDFCLKSILYIPTALPISLLKLFFQGLVLIHKKHVLRNT